MFNTLFIKITAIGTIVFIALALLLVLAIVQKKENAFSAFVIKNKLATVFTVAIIAMIGSLIYSNRIGFPPCDLCWYQRIFMYPIVFIAGYGWYKKDMRALAYTKILTVVGGIISLYHNFIYYTNINPLPCSATASCTARYVFEFGFVTIPLMALFVFALILLIVLRNPQQESQTVAQ